MAKINYDGRIFRPLETSGTGEVDEGTLFYYHQSGDIVWAEYSGGDIVRGHLIAVCGPDAVLDMRYHHINSKNEVMTGECTSTPEILPDGRIRLYEKWRWTSGDLSRGTSILEEI